MSIKQGGNTIAGLVREFLRYVSNCITYIPQDIKVEESTTQYVSTIKAGTKIYIPNGAGVFDEFVFPYDYNVLQATSNQYLYIYRYDGTVDYMSYDNFFSGPNAPTGLQSTYAYWYDTTNNVIKYTSDSGATWTGGNSLPLFAYTNGTLQVFNGFGYIGSTVFALPGVKGLIPNGLNPDGSLKNTEYSISNVLTRTFTTPGGQGAGYVCAIALLNNDNFDRENYYTLTQDNYLLGSDGVIYQGFEVFKVVFDSNVKITSFTPKTVFHAVDYNDTEYMAHQAMPSGRYIDLALGASGSIYTAPADGYFMLKGQTTTATNLAYGLFNISAASVGMLLRINANGVDFRAFTMASKGQTVRVIYEAALNNVEFRFIYAQGAQ